MTVGRAERLRVLLDVCRGIPYLPPEEASEFMSASDLAALEDADGLDLALLNACLAVEADLRERDYAALEQLGTLVAGGAGDGWSARVLSLPERERIEALSAVLDLGWINSER